MSQQGLLMDLPIAEPLTKVTPYHRGEIRVKRPVRNQVEMMVPDLDSLIADDHAIRSIWEFLNKLDLSAFYSSIKAALDQPGRPASDPQVLLALWVYATAIIREYKFVKLTCQVACNSPIPPRERTR